MRRPVAALGAPRVAAAAAPAAPRPPVRSATALSLVRGGNSYSTMQANIDAVKATSASLEGRATLLDRMSAARKSSSSAQAHKLAWHDAAQKLAQERNVAESRLREHLQAMRNGCLAEEGMELQRDEIELTSKRSLAANALTEQVASLRAKLLAPSAPNAISEILRSLRRSLQLQLAALGDEERALEAEAQRAQLEFRQWPIEPSGAEPPSGSGGGFGCAAGVGMSAVSQLRRELADAAAAAAGTGTGAGTGAATGAAMGARAGLHTALLPADGGPSAQSLSRGRAVPATIAVPILPASALPDRSELARSLLLQLQELDERSERARAAMLAEFADVLAGSAGPQALAQGLARATLGSEPGGEEAAGAAEANLSMAAADAEAEAEAEAEATAESDYWELSAPGQIAEQHLDSVPAEPAAAARERERALPQPQQTQPLQQTQPQQTPEQQAQPEQEQMQLISLVAAQYHARPRSQLLERLCQLLPHCTEPQLQLLLHRHERTHAFARRQRALAADLKRSRARLAEDAVRALAQHDLAADAAARREQEHALLEVKRTGQHAALAGLRSARAVDEERAAEAQAAHAAVEDAIAEARSAAEAVERQHIRRALAQHRDAVDRSRLSAEAAAAEAAAAEAVQHAEELKEGAKRTRFRAAQLTQRARAARAKAEVLAAEHAAHAAALESFFERVRPLVEADPQRLLQPTSSSSAAAEESGPGAFQPVRGFRDDELATDMRHKIFGALVEAGLQHSEYGRKLVLAATPAVPAHLKSAIPFMGNKGFDMSSRHDAYGA